MNTRVSLLIAAGLVTLAVAFAPLVPAPFGFWLGLMAAVGGPGLGLPRLMFAHSTLTLPERLLVTTLMSIFLTTGTLAALNALGILLTPLVIASVLLALTYTTVLAALCREHTGSLAQRSLPVQPVWLAFGGGIALAVWVTIGTLRLLGM